MTYSVNQVALGSGKSHLEHCLGQGRVEVKAVLQSFDYDVFSEVQAVAVEETMVCQSVHHGTWPSRCRW
jgi:hypothetical protein